VYAVLCKIWPVQIYPTEQQSSESTAWETMVPTEGFFHDDETMPEYVKDKVLFGVEPTTTVSSQEENVRRGSVEGKEGPPQSKF
jgi:NCS1 family nucleobase:cation symporter-1